MFRTFAHDGEVKDFITLEQAISESLINQDIRLITFHVETGEEVRLVKYFLGWVYEDANGYRRI